MPMVSCSLSRTPTDHTPRTCLHPRFHRVRVSILLFARGESLHVDPLRPTPHRALQLPVVSLTLGLRTSSPALIQKASYMPETGGYEAI